MSSLAELSILRVAVAPQDMHCQRLEPAAVLPWPFVLPPHTGHLRFAMGKLNGIAPESEKPLPRQARQEVQGYTFWPALQFVERNCEEQKEGDDRPACAE